MFAINWACTAVGCVSTEFCVYVVLHYGVGVVLMVYHIKTLPELGSDMNRTNKVNISIGQIKTFNFN